MSRKKRAGLTVRISENWVLTKDQLNWTIFYGRHGLEIKDGKILGTSWKKYPATLAGVADIMFHTELASLDTEVDSLQDLHQLIKQVEQDIRQKFSVCFNDLNQ